MLRRSWKPIIGTTVLVGGPSYLYYKYSKPTQQTFDFPVRVRGPDGKATMTTRSFNLLTKSDVDARLSANAHTHTPTLTSGHAYTYTTASLASNNPIEDASASAVLPRREALDSQTTAAGDLLFHAVMDGHGGYHTSRLLSKILIPAVALELKELIEEPSQVAPKGNALMNFMRSFFGSANNGSSSPAAFDADPRYVSVAMQSAFANLDSELINAPLKLLAQNVDAKARESKVLPDLSQHPMALATMLPAMSGSCAILALFDTAHKSLYVANTGDARAVAGFWDERADGTGTWRVEVLSEDQTGRNPSEFLRVQSEHPPEEAPFVIQRGRILGGLEPSRAFGDARYKWPRDIQDLLSRAFLQNTEHTMRPAPSALKTPPYVTSRPVVTHTSFVGAASGSTTRSSLRFVILATDGLWDKLSSGDAAALVAAHLSGVRDGSVTKSELAQRVPVLLGDARGIEGKEDKAGAGGDVRWAFEDANLSAHLIRNALGGADEDSLRKIMSLPAPISRRYRDDITVTVVVLPQEAEAAAVKARL